MTAKRKHVKVTLKKPRALQEPENRKSAKSIAVKFNVSGSVLSRWKKNKEKTYDKFWTSSLCWQKVKIGVYEKINQACWNGSHQWVETTFLSMGHFIMIPSLYKIWFCLIRKPLIIHQKTFRLPRSYLILTWGLLDLQLRDETEFHVVVC